MLIQLRTWLTAAGLVATLGVIPLGCTPKGTGTNFAPTFIAGLSETKGCLGVDAGRTMSGKSVIFAWFQDKQAALRWYHSQTHRDAMDNFFPGATGSDREPLADVPDGVPLLVIASITMANSPESGASGTPFSQIAIEFYSPVSGGLSLGGRFAPDSLHVPGVVLDYTIETSSATHAE